MSYARQSQPKAQTEANARTLRALVKQPDNKVCADCKRNDPRWASWNLGCFLCIRCSGIHRSMGTHISRVKSIDLDIWTPEQMASIQMWGNKRCNLYWEAHLKAGHVPPEHKVESFVRSKYEMRRWAKDGPVPSDPATLEGGVAEVAAETPAPSASNGASGSASSLRKSVSGKAAPPSAIDLLGGDGDGLPRVGQATTSITTSGNATAPPAPAQTSKTSTNASTGGGGGLFDLDWQDGPTSNASLSSPTSSSLANPTKGSNKNDILSLFASSSRPAGQTTGPRTSGGGLDAFSSLSLGSSTQATSSANFQAPPASDPWASLGSPTSGSQANASVNNGNVWAGNNASSDPWGSFGSPPSKAGSANASSNDIWGKPVSSSIKSPTSSTLSGNAHKSNDAFADIWGDFK